MSMRSYTVEGCGIDASVLSIGVNEKIAFMKQFLPKAYQEMQDEIRNGVTDDLTNTSEYIDACEDWISKYEDESGKTGFGAVFSDAISENEDGFNTSYEVGEHDKAILYGDRAPWEMSERVLKMKDSSQMKDIFAKYLNALGVTEFEFDRQSVEYYG